HALVVDVVLIDVLRMGEVPGFPERLEVFFHIGRLMTPTAAQPAAPLHLHAQGERHQYEKDEEQTTAATGSRVVHGAWSQERKGFVLTASLSHVQYVQRSAERVGRLRQLEGAREDIRFQ